MRVIHAQLLISLSLVAGITLMAINHIAGWGWLVFVLILVISAGGSVSSDRYAKAIRELERDLLLLDQEFTRISKDAPEGSLNSVLAVRYTHRIEAIKELFNSK